MRFRLFGIPVHIQPWFWLTTALLGLPSLQQGSVSGFLIWVLAILIAVTIHELGHAAAILRHGMRPEITLHAMGGTTSSGPLSGLSRPAQAFVAFAGPLAGFVVAGALYGLGTAFPGIIGALPALVVHLLDQLIVVNLFLGIMNLAPVLPFDGGHILEASLGPRRVDLAAAISQVVGGVITVAFLAISQTWGALLFGMSTFQNVQRNPGAIKRAWLKLKLGRLEAQAEALRGGKGAAARRPGAPALRVIRGGADKPRDPRDLN